MNGANKECLFLFVYASASRARAEPRGKHPLSKRSQRRTTGRPSLHWSLWLVYASILTPPESVKQCEWQQRNKKLLISPQPRAAKQTQCRPRVDLWLLCVSDDSAALSFTAKTRWMLIIGSENWEVILRLKWELELSDNFWIKEDFRSMLCCVLITEWKTSFILISNRKKSVSDHTEPSR